MDPSVAKLAEDSILNTTDLYDGVDYAISLMKRRWPELEKKILTSKYEFEGLILYIDYIQTFIKKRLLEFENVLLNFRDIQLMSYYAEKIIQGRWPAAEQEMLNQKKILEANFHSVDDYEEIDDELENEDDLNDLTILEPYIYDDMEVIENKISETIDTYAFKVIKGPWKKAGIK